MSEPTLNLESAARNVDDGQHFLKIEFTDGGLNTSFLCEADPKTSPCRDWYNPHECWIKVQYDDVGPEMIAKPGERDDIKLLVPVKYYSQGLDESYEDWIEPVRPRPQSQAQKNNS